MSSSPDGRARCGPLKFAEHVTTPDLTAGIGQNNGHHRTLPVLQGDTDGISTRLMDSHVRNGGNCPVVVLVEPPGCV